MKEKADGMNWKKYGRNLAAAVTAIALSAGVFLAGFEIGTGTDALTINANELTAAAGSYTSLDSAQPNYMRTAATAQSGIASYSDVYKAVSGSVVSINTVSLSQTGTQIFPDAYNFILPPGFSYGFPSGSGQSAAPREIPGAASGIIFYEDKDNVYIITNFHVVNGAVSCTISVDDETSIPATYVGGDEYSDVAVLSVAKTDLNKAGVEYEIAVFGDSDAMEIGDQVMAVGNANGEGKSATLGIVSATNKRVYYENVTYHLLQTDAAINKGNSGGPLVNMNGEVIGINVLKVISGGVEGMGYAIPVNSILGLVEEIMDTGTVSRPYLGIEGMTIDKETMEENGLAATGVYVANILPGLTAEAMGVQPGDIITAYNGTEITDMEQLRELIQKTKVGDKLKLEVVRTTYRGSNSYFRGASSAVSTETLTLEGTMLNYTTDPEF